MKIDEIMKSPVITVEEDLTIEECGRLLQEHDINGAPVVHDHRVVGVITRADIFRSVLPRYPDIYKDEKHLSDLGYIQNRIRKVKKIKVREVMGAPAMTLNQDTSILKAGSILTLRKIKQMPVMKDDTLVGVITLADVFRHIMEVADQK